MSPFLWLAAAFGYLIVGYVVAVVIAAQEETRTIDWYLFCFASLIWPVICAVLIIILAIACIGQAIMFAFKPIKPRRWTAALIHKFNPNITDKTLQQVNGGR